MLYLAAILDLYSRKIVGWQLADHMRAELIGDAIDVRIRKIEHGPENAAIERAKRSWAENLCNDRVYTQKTSAIFFMPSF